MSTAALADTEFALVFDHGPHPYLLLHPDERFTIAAVNRQYLSVTGRSAEELIGHGMFEAFPDNPADPHASGVADLHASLERVLRDRAQDVMGVQRYDNRPDGAESFEERYWSAVNSPIFRDDGEIAYILHHVRDVTEFVHVRDAAALDRGAQRDLNRMQAEVLLRASQQKEANRQLKAALEEVERRKLAAEAANRELDAFSYSVAHDLRAPLRSIDGFSQALLEDYAGALDETGQQFLRYVRESAQQMGQLIDDLLGLARVARSEFRREPVDLSALSRDIAARLQRSQPERRLEWVIADGVQVRGDTRLLQVALENLLGNAWKFTGKRQSGRIEVGALRGADGQPEYFVADNGAGFDPAYSAKLFGVFQRLHSAADFDGTGVGLATVQRIVHRHGGKIRAQGEVDRGARFIFTLGEGDADGAHPA